VPDDSVMVDEETAVLHEGTDLSRRIGELNPVLERVVREHLEHPRDPRLVRSYSRPHAEGSWDHTG